MIPDWPVVELGRHLRVKHGLAFRGEYFGHSGDFIVLTPGNFYDEGGFKSKDGGEKFYTAPPPPEYVLKRNDLVVAMTEQVQGLLGSSALIPCDDVYLHNQRIGLVELQPDVDRRFIYHLFNTSLVRDQIQATATGAKIRHTAPSRIEAVKVPLPPLEIQRKIGVILSTYDDLIENNSRRVKLLDELGQRIYGEWFVDFRYPGHEDASFVDSPTGSIPAGWRTSTLGDVSRNFDRRRKPLSGIERAQRPGPFPYYGAAKVFDYIDDYLFDGTYLLVAEDGSVITPDGCPVTQYVTGKFWANNHTHVLQGETVSTEYLTLVLSRQPISGYVTGAAQPKLTQANLNRIPVTVPPERVATRFDEHVLPIFRLRHLLERERSALQESRDRLRPQLISGELDVQDLDIAVEEAA